MAATYDSCLYNPLLTSAGASSAASAIDALLPSQLSAATYITVGTGSLMYALQSLRSTTMAASGVCIRGALMCYHNALVSNPQNLATIITGGDQNVVPLASTLVAFNKFRMSFFKTRATEGLPTAANLFLFNWDCYPIVPATWLSNAQQAAANSAVEKMRTLSACPSVAMRYSHSPTLISTLTPNDYVVGDLDDPLSNVDYDTTELTSALINTQAKWIIRCLPTNSVVRDALSGFTQTVLPDNESVLIRNF